MVCVASRTEERAREWASEHSIPKHYASYEALLQAHPSTNYWGGGEKSVAIELLDVRRCLLGRGIEHNWSCADTKYYVGRRGRRSLYTFACCIAQGMDH